MLLICYGTRPEYLKVQPLMEKMKGEISFRTLFTGQHVDLVKQEADYKIEIKPGRNRLDSLVSSIMNSFNFKKEGITNVLVQGDTTSAFAIALTAFQHKIPIIHLEAGLRTYDLKQPYPEEANRQMISRLATIHLCPTDSSRKILMQERVRGEIKVVGNTILDNLHNIHLVNKKKVLVTLHRTENHEHMKEWFIEIEKLSKKYFDYEFLLPIHPNPAVRRHREILENVKVVEPMEYENLILYLSQCSFVITDSGGIQEEASFLKKPCLVCRKETERLEGLNNFSLLCVGPSKLMERFEQLKLLRLEGKCPYGDGHSSSRIVKILKSKFGRT